jgi:hypothetical protein
MSSAEDQQHGIVEALDAEAQPIRARSAKTAQFLQISVARIAFQCYFSILRHREARADLIQKLIDLRGLHQARGSAADEHAMDRARLAGVLRQLVFQRQQVRVDAIKTGGLTVEVAVWADR